MITDILHVGVTVSDLDRSVAFYRDIVGLRDQGELLMEGPATHALFVRPGCAARVGYLKGGDTLSGPSLELIQFTTEEPEHQATDLFRTSISEICFCTEDIWAEYRRLTALGVEFLSQPQSFDFTAAGFGKSMAVYFRDPDGNIIELMQPL